MLHESTALCVIQRLIVWEVDNDAEDWFAVDKVVECCTLADVDSGRRFCVDVAVGGRVSVGGAGRSRRTRRGLEDIVCAKEYVFPGQTVSSSVKNLSTERAQSFRYDVKSLKSAKWS